MSLEMDANIQSQLKMVDFMDVSLNLNLTRP